MKEPKSGPAQPKMTSPLESYLTYKLSGVDLADDTSTRPMCSLCDIKGESENNLLIETGEPVYVCASWREYVGWKLFGIYHRSHDVSDISDSDTPRPVALVEGELEKTENRTYDESPPDSCTLRNLSLVDVSYPGALDY